MKPIPYLARTNSLQRSHSGIWTTRQQFEFDYSDGDDNQLYLARTVATVADRSSLSNELASRIRDWTSEYHFSPLRSNLLRALCLKDRTSALEIGAGCGAITRYLGELKLQVDAIEGSYQRAEIAKARCAGLQNVAVYGVNVFDITLPPNAYDLICFIGVLEYASKFAPNLPNAEQAISSLLDSAKRSLSPGGVIVIAIENRLGLKYVLGAGEDHYGRPYEGIHNYPNFSGIKTYSKREWETLLAEHGFCHEFLYPFPDYKLPQQILADRFVAGQPSAWSQLPDAVSTDYHNLMANTPEAPIWASFQQTGVLGDFSNSFLIVAAQQESSLRNVVDQDFVHVSGLSRKLEFRTITRKSRSNNIVSKLPLVEKSPKTSNLPVLHVMGESPFSPGVPLSCSWAQRLRISPSRESFIDLAREYYTYLTNLIAGGHTLEKIVDLTPTNILVQDDNTFTFIDQEWETTFPISTEFILFRGLFYFIQNHQTLFLKILNNSPGLTVGQFIHQCFRELGIENDESLSTFIHWEESIQKTICHERYGLTTTDFLDQHLHTTTHPVRLLWCTPGASFSPDHSALKLVSMGIERQEVAFDLPNGTLFPVSLRFHPGPGEGYFRLFSISTKVKCQDKDDEVHRLRSGQDIAHYATLSGLIYSTDHERDIFVTLDNDASLEWIVPAQQPQQAEQEIQVIIEMDWIRSAEFRLIQGAILEKYGQLIRSAEKLESTNQTLRRDITRLTNSRVMRAATSVKKRLPSFLFKHRALKAPAPESALTKAKDAVMQPSNPLHPPTGSPNGSASIAIQNQEESDLFGREYLSTAGQLQRAPLISVLMPVFNTNIAWLRAAIQSIKTQSYHNWELCIVNDNSDDDAIQRLIDDFSSPTIRTRYLSERQNISGATNEALRMAQGEYVVLMDHDDLLSKHALSEVVRAINDSHPDVIYSDEDFIEIDGTFSQPHFKPDYSPDLLLSHNYITHLTAVRRELCIELGGFRKEYDGAQDYDFLLRLTDDPNRAVHHIPKVLYHWRKSAGSTSLNPDIKPAAEIGAKNALADTLRRRKINGDVEYAGHKHFFRVRRRHTDELVSIIVPFKDQSELLKKCLAAISERTAHSHYEVIGISNNSDSPHTFSLMQDIAEHNPKFRFVEQNIPFNFSSLVNFGVANASGGQIVLLNNDTEIINWQWIDALLEHSQRHEIGVVGGKLYYPNNTIQHAGIIVGTNGYAGHAHKGRHSSDDGYFNRASIIQNISAVTGAFMMFKRDVFDHLNGFDSSFAVACNDVDFCLRALEEGYSNVFTPYAQAYHHESASRGYDTATDKALRFFEEKSRFELRHRKILHQGDPFYNVNLSLTTERFEVGHAGRRFYRDACDPDSG